MVLGLHFGGEWFPRHVCTGSVPKTDRQIAKWKLQTLPTPRFTALCSTWAALVKNTPKRHILWSNNSGLLDQVFQKAGYMSRAEQAALKDSLVKPYTDKNGQRRFVGIKSKLKDSQRLV